MLDYSIIGSLKFLNKQEDLEKLTSNQVFFNKKNLITLHRVMSLNNVIVGLEKICEIGIMNRIRYYILLFNNFIIF